MHVNIHSHLFGENFFFFFLSINGRGSLICRCMGYMVVDEWWQSRGVFVGSIRALGASGLGVAWGRD